MRPRKPREPRKPRAPRGAYFATSGSVGGGELVQAAEEIADGARDFAAWGPSVVASIRTEQVDENVVNVVADAPAAYPGETRAKHPLFGNRRHWYGPPGQPFLRPAAAARAGDAAAKYAAIVDRLAKDRGWEPA